MDKKLQRIQELAAENRRRQMDAVRCYRPTETQLKFHESLASERIVRGGKRCLAGEQEIYDPVVDRHRSIDGIDCDFHVWAVNPHTGTVEVARASKPFIKGQASLYETTLESGRSFTSSLGHVVYDGKTWKQLCSASQLQVVHVQEGSSSSREDPLNYQRKSGFARRSCVETRQTPQACHASTVPRSCASESRVCEELAELSLDQDSAYRQSLALSCRHRYTSHTSHHGHQECSLGNLTTSIASTTYKRHGAIWDIEVPGYDNYIMAGVLHHNSGKTVSCSAEFASAVTGLAIRKRNGKLVPRKYPKDDMLCWIIGYDLRHIGSTIYRVLFEPGYFKIFQKPDGSWRTLNPANPVDAKLMDKGVPAGPMIPPRMIIQKSWAWESKSDHCFRAVSIRSPFGVARIEAFPSTALQPKQGDAVDLIWIDEDIRFSYHVHEYQDRLSDKKGRLIWSAWPHGTNDALVDMSQRAAEQCEDENPDVHEIVLRFSDNPFIDPEEKRKATARMTTEEERRSRDYGEFLLDSIAMYEFIPSVHGVNKIDEDDEYYAGIYKKDNLNLLYTEHGRFPDSWTRYLALDPSHTRSAVLFGVVPPPSEFPNSRGKVLIIEDELILKKHSASELAEAVNEKVLGKQYEAFIIDHNASRQTSIGMTVGQSIGVLYESAFAERGLKSRLTGSSFIPGNNKVEPRCMEVRELLRPDNDGMPSLRFAIDSTYHTQKEFRTYRKKLVFDEILDTPANARTHDAMSALEYLVSYIYNAEEPYVDQSKFKKESPAYRKARSLMQKWKDKEDGEYCHIGPGAK